MASNSHPDWQPTCSQHALQVRAAMLKAVRTFFDTRGYLEVETPVMLTDVVVDAHLNPFTVQTSHGTFYLQTSPEAGMKRLLAAGSGSIYQITRAFRAGERGERHNPEFTMIEWYGVDTDDFDQMTLTSELVLTALNAALPLTGRNLTSGWGQSAKGFLQQSYDEIFRGLLGISVINSTTEEIRAACHSRAIQVPSDLDKDNTLNFVLGTVIEPTLGTCQPVFVYHYPATQAALAQLDPENPSVARRFELYIDGVELCNGYFELSDPTELQLRDHKNNLLRESQSESALPGAPLMMAAMTHGLPSCSGVALGFDRLVMLAMGTNHISQVIPFPQ